ncbi:MAG: tyrosine decarboxylase MfnA [Candidatus Thermoplasmatota archaeon]|nr:tyrosine decarboxylase MfnA [Candidatus Thermoplasmatota archaeon]
MPTKTVDKRERKILEKLSQFQNKDYSFSSGRILGSMCSQPHPIAKKAYYQFLETNIGDPGLFPGTKEMEIKFLTFILKLLNAPHTASGHIVSGGTEGNISAMWLAKQITGKKEIILPSSAHFSFEKIASMMNMKLVSMPVTKQHIMDISQIKKHINNDTAAIIGIAGTTDVGAIDPIPELSEICNEEHLFFHVDAAFGGFIIPFLKQMKYDLPAFDFTLPGVSTISLDAHKMGYAAIPLGTLVLRDKKWLKEISVKSQCISTKKQAGILGTRSGGSVAAGYAVTEYLQYNGYQQLIQTIMETTKYTIKKIEDIGLSLVTKPTLNVITVNVNQLDEVVDTLETYGWKVNKIEHLSSFRIVIMPQITKSIIDEFIPALEKTCHEVGEL